MGEIVSAQSGGVTFEAELDLARGEWSAAEERPEGEFPFVAQAGGKRYELYSDHTFAESERADAPLE